MHLKMIFIFSDILDCTQIHFKIVRKICELHFKLEFDLYFNVALFIWPSITYLQHVASKQATSLLNPTSAATGFIKNVKDFYIYLVARKRKKNQRLETNIIFFRSV